MSVITNRINHTGTVNFLFVLIFTAHTIIDSVTGIEDTCFDNVDSVTPRSNFLIYFVIFDRSVFHSVYLLAFVSFLFFVSKCNLVSVLTCFPLFPATSYSYVFFPIIYILFYYSFVMHY